MRREDAIQEIRRNWEPLLAGITVPAQRNVNGRTSYVCPLCGHGAHGDGLTVNPKNKTGAALKCFGSCGFSGDILDLIQQAEGKDFNGAIERAAAELGIVIDATEARTATAREDFRTADDKTAAESTKAPQTASACVTEGIADYREYYKICRERLQDPAAISYLEARGISLINAEVHGLGFDPAWISPTVRANQAAKGSSWLPPASARIIMPVSKNYYVARSIAPKEGEAKKMNETGGGSVGIFNAGALHSDGEAVFVVEGIFDALSLEEIGAAAIALNSTSNAGALVDLLEKKPTAKTLIICLDNDKAGRTATEKLRSGLNRLNISFITANINCGFKDPNEALTNSTEAFIAAVRRAIEQTAAKPDNTSAYIDYFMPEDLEKMKAAAGKNTGFDRLDEQSGGLYPGLYVIAATSSLGKTTFSLQIADNLATAGHDVLFFSLEQSRLELVSKSLARTMYKEDPLAAATSLQIRKGTAPGAALRHATGIYKAAVGDRMSIIEGNFNCTISFIGDYVRRYIKQTGSSPVIFIDYLQILQPEESDKRSSVKEIVDNTVTELKRLSRELDLTIFVISSVNRANYLTPIDFESLKETGGIEYTADVIWGLQFVCLDNPIFSMANKIKEKRNLIKQAKAESPRKIALVCLKNRYGIANFNSLFEYYPANDTYINKESLDMAIGWDGEIGAEEAEDESRI